MTTKLSVSAQYGDELGHYSSIYH